VAATGGVANAATNLSITGCSTNVGVLTAGLIVNCSAPTGTIYNPTQITLTVNKTALTALLGDLGVGVKVKYDLTCSVDRGNVTKPQQFTATKPNQNKQVVNLMQTVGSPEPNQCQVQNLSATSPAKCEDGQWAAPNQTWKVMGNPYTAGEITRDKAWCLSAPASGMVDGAQLSARHCGAPGYEQWWKAPGNTPV
jgi:hypothetical protein